MDINDTEPKQWIERAVLPEWAKKAVRARERGKCANCLANITEELEADEQIDHIVPLSKGGTNDLCNLQVLCGTCNNKKSANQVAVVSSVPKYFKAARRLSRA